MRAAVALLCLCLLAFGIAAPTSSYHGKSAVIHDGSSLSAPTDFDGRLDHRELTALGLGSESRCNFDADTNELLDDVERMPNLRSTCFRHRLTAFAKTVILVTGEIGLAFFALVAFLVTVTYLWPDRIKRATTLDSHTVHSMVSRSESRDK
uniref:Uncharacterized protein n=1 Tax=Bionectria ochroleuca TaxID=29856 RepID=A0A8H7TQC2_BIOOC